MERTTLHMLPDARAHDHEERANMTHAHFTHALLDIDISYDPFQPRPIFNPSRRRFHESTTGWLTRATKRTQQFSTTTNKEKQITRARSFDGSGFDSQRPRRGPHVRHLGRKPKNEHARKLDTT